MVVSLAFLTSVLTGQENCFNGIDDDGDGDIDMADIDCVCAQIQDGALIADFEELTCCPDNFTGGGLGIECLEGWTSASLATTDYLNTCDFIGGTAVPTIPQPIPSGEGAIGFATLLNYSEMVGQCMEQTMLAGETYDVQMSVGFHASGGIQSNSPYVMAIFGTSSCDNFPLNLFDCPTNDPAWVELASISVEGDDDTWTTVNFSFTAPSNIEAIAFGAACSELTNPVQYHFLDNIIISGFYGDPPDLIETIEQSGDCISGVELSIDGDPGLTYQWYLNGNPIPGATGSTYNPLASEPGTYVVVVENGMGCTESDTIEVDVDTEVLDVIGDVTDVECFGDETGTITLELPTQNEPITVLWESGETTDGLIDLPPGMYMVTITDANGCTGVETFEISPAG